MDILAAIVGGFLAAGTGWLLQNRLEASRIKKQRKLLILGITDDLNNSIALYDQLSEDWQRSKIVWFNLITELSDSRHPYVNNRDLILFIPDNQLRQRISQYYRKSGLYLLSLQNAQQRKYDIENQYNSAMQKYQLANTNVAPDAAREIVARSMDRETQELAYWNEHLPTLIGGLERFKGEAREILHLLK